MSQRYFNKQAAMNADTNLTCHTILKNTQDLKKSQQDLKKIQKQLAKQLELLVNSKYSKAKYLEEIGTYLPVEQNKDTRIPTD